MKVKNASPIFLFFLVVLLAMLCAFFTGAANAAEGNQLKLAWDANAETDLAGYKLYYDTTGAGELFEGEGADQGKSPIDIPLATLTDAAAPAYALTGLPEAKYVFAVTAYNGTGIESDHSNKVKANFVPPEPPSSLRLLIEKIVAWLRDVFGKPVRA